MNEDRAKGFGVVGFKALDHELDGSVIHVGQREASHVKDDGLDYS